MCDQVSRIFLAFARKVFRSLGVAHGVALDVADEASDGLVLARGTPKLVHSMASLGHAYMPAIEELPAVGRWKGV